MFRWLHTCMFLLCGMVLPAQEFFYYGVNSEPVEDTSGAMTMKEVRRKSGTRIVITSRQRTNGDWSWSGKTRMRFREEGRILVRQSGPEGILPVRFVREYRRAEDTVCSSAAFLFRDVRDNRIFRKGSASSLVPLHLDGELTTYHENGSVKTIAVFHENQLQSNQNWLPDGSRYIDDLFYSADRVPEFEYGVEFFNSYLIQRLKTSGYDLSLVEDRVVIGWVIMENGKLESPVALEGESIPLRELLVEIISDLPGTWEPAVLDGRYVRYFISLPLNFHRQDITFQNLEVSGSVLHYDTF